MKIRYCGNCNPDVHPRLVRAALDRISRDLDPDTVVAVNGCSRICITKGKVRGIPGDAVIMNAGDLAGVAEVEAPAKAVSHGRSPARPVHTRAEDFCGGVYESH